MIVREIRLFYRVVHRDVSASMIPAMLFSLAAFHAVGRPWTVSNLAAIVLANAVYFALYIYTFCLGNQIVGREEDALNKPDRVLPSGAMSLTGAWSRWAIVNAVFPVVGFSLGGWTIARWALAWQLVSISYNSWGLHRHWLTKNVVFITLGTIVQLAPAWELVQPADAMAWRWILVIAIAFGLTLHLQDLRDVQGDRAMGRRTLPIAMGETPTRWLLFGSIMSLPVITRVGLMHETASSTILVICEATLALINVVVGIRVLLLRSPRADHVTYQLHTYWFCLALASAIPALG